VKPQPGDRLAWIVVYGDRHQYHALFDDRARAEIAATRLPDALIYQLVVEDTGKTIRAGERGGLSS
jgi:hypothetical protein